MSEFVFDTVILIDALRDVEAAKKELGRRGRKWISRITWIEVMAGAQGDDAPTLEEFLHYFSVIELSEEIGRRAAEIRIQHRRIKLPDAIIWASAQTSGRILVTRNSRDFPAQTLVVRIPYSL